MIRNSNIVQANLLHHTHDDTNTFSIEVDSLAWFEWLEQNHTFSFDGAMGHFTVRKEKRPGGVYWYGYRRYSKKLYRLYVGKSEELSLHRLEEIARLLAEQIASLTTASIESKPVSLMANTVPPPLPSPTKPTFSKLLLATKLSIPPAYANKMMVRTQLELQLSTALRSKLTLLTAAPGFGKTTLLAEWIRQNKIPATWLTLDDGDNDPSRFWSYCFTALENLQAGVGQAALNLLQAAQTPSIETVLITLINSLSSCNEPTITHDFIFVLDDYHLIENSVIHSAVAFLLEKMPSQMHLIISGRNTPPLPLSRLRAKGQLSEISMSDLRFSSQETATFLQEVMGLYLTEDDLALLFTRTEGWITGLQLVALSLGKRADVSSFLRNFKASERFVFDYLAEEVLAQLPENTCSFLLKTSIVERMNSQLCEVLSEQSNGQAMLVALERSNLFVIPLDEERYWYRYHQLFAEFLRSRLPTAQLSGLHKRASEWYEQNQLLPEAITHGLAAQDYARTAKLIEKTARALLGSGEITTLIKWLQSLPAELLDTNPHLHIFYAWTLIWVGEMTQAEQHLQRVEILSVANPVAATLDTEIAIIRLTAAAFQVDIEQIISLTAQIPLSSTQSNPFLRGFQELSAAIVCEMHGDRKKASHFYRSASEIGRAASNLLVALVALSQQGDLEMGWGHLRRAVEIYQDALAFATVSTKVLPPASIAYLGLAQVFYEWNELDEALAYIRLGLEAGQSLGNNMFLMMAHLCQARIKQATGDENGALTVLDELAQRLPPDSPAIVTDFIELIRARFCVTQGKLAEAGQWAERFDQSQLTKNTIELQPLRVYELTTLVRVLLAQAKPQEAFKYLDELQHDTLAQESTTTYIEVLVLKALAYNLTGQVNMAVQTLTEALILAEPEGYVRLLLDEGLGVATLLKRVKSITGQLSKNYLHKLMAASSKQLNIIALNESSHSKPESPTLALLEPLSQREVAVLKLLKAGLSNQEIAQQLIVEVSTVKTHLIRLYSKLGVHNRAQAVIAAKTLNL
jgi:LuxR family maltose regulon positive regulatory protein